MKRIVDPKVIRWVVYERDRCCLYGFFYGDPCGDFSLSAHHMEKRSQLGDDVPENLITLCNHHHEMAEKRLIPVIKFMIILNALYGYTYKELEDGKEKAEIL